LKKGNEEEIVELKHRSGLVRKTSRKSRRIAVEIAKVEGDSSEYSLLFEFICDIIINNAFTLIAVDKIMQKRWETTVYHDKRWKSRQQHC
jgi:hypothetical protein